MESQMVEFEEKIMKLLREETDPRLLARLHDLRYMVQRGSLPLDKEYKLLPLSHQQIRELIRRMPTVSTRESEEWMRKYFWEEHHEKILPFK